MTFLFGESWFTQPRHFYFHVSSHSPLVPTGASTKLVPLLFFQERNSSRFDWPASLTDCQWTCGRLHSNSRRTCLPRGCPQLHQSNPSSTSSWHQEQHLLDMPYCRLTISLMVSTCLSNGHCEFLSMADTILLGHKKKVPAVVEHVATLSHCERGSEVLKANGTWGYLVGLQHLNLLFKFTDSMMT